MRHVLEKKDKTVDAIVKATFPQYKGRKVNLDTDVPHKLDSFWQGGSRDYYAFYELATGEVEPVKSNHPFFERGRPNYLESLPPGVVLVKHHYFEGHDMGITIYANAENLTRLLQAPIELTIEEKVVLRYTRSLQNTYGGETNIRFREAHQDTGISAEAWDTAKVSLIEKKLLTKAGAIKPKGENALEQYNLNDANSKTEFGWRNLFRKPSLPSQE